MHHPQTAPFRRSLIALALAAGNLAHAGGLPTLQEVTVSSGKQNLTGIADSATEGTVSSRQLANRQPEELARSLLRDFVLANREGMLAAPQIS